MCRTAVLRDRGCTPSSATPPTAMLVQTSAFDASRYSLPSCGGHAQQATSFLPACTSASEEALAPTTFAAAAEDDPNSQSGAQTVLALKAAACAASLTKATGRESPPRQSGAVVLKPAWASPGSREPELSCDVSV